MKGAYKPDFTYPRKNFVGRINIPNVNKLFNNI